MKKIYLIPALQVEKALVTGMMAESLAINSDTTVDGGDALTKESAWDIWSED